MATRRGRLARFRLPTILESDGNLFLDADTQESSDGPLQYVAGMVLVVLVLGVCWIGLLTSNVSSGHFADVRYVDTHINELQDQMAVLQLTLESQSYVSELHAIRDELRALYPHQSTSSAPPANATTARANATATTTVRANATTVRANSTTTPAVGAADFEEATAAPPSTTVALGAADFNEPVTTSTAVIEAADYAVMFSEPGTAEPDID